MYKFKKKDQSHIDLMCLEFYVDGEKNEPLSNAV